MDRLLALAGPYPALTLGALALLALLSTGLLVSRYRGGAGAAPFLPRRPASPDVETYKPKHDPRLGDAALVFPPQRRAALARLLPAAARRPAPTAAELRARQLPTTRTPDLARDGQLTPTGLAAEEVRALGPFPDYAALSGVPAPRPVGPGFDIAKAAFRPFRPFRWAYHQTMGAWVPSWLFLLPFLSLRGALAATTLPSCPRAQFPCPALAPLQRQFH